METKKLIRGLALILAVAACHPQNTTDSPSPKDQEEQTQATISGNVEQVTDISLMEATLHATAYFEGRSVLVMLYYAPGILKADEVVSRGEQISGDNQSSGQSFSRRIKGLKIGTDYSCVLQVTDVADGSSFLSEVTTFKTCGVTFEVMASASQAGEVSASATYTTDAPSKTYTVYGSFYWSDTYDKAEDIVKYGSGSVGVSWEGTTLSSDNFYTGATTTSPKTIRMVFTFTFKEYSVKPTYEQTLYSGVRTLFVQPQSIKI